MKSLIIALVVLVAIARSQSYPSSCIPGGGSYFPGSGSLPPLPSGSGSLPPLPSGSGSLPPLPSGSMPPSGSYGPPLLTMDFAPEDFEEDETERRRHTWKPRRRHDKHYRHSHHHYNPSGSSFLPPYSGSGSMPPLPPCPSGSGYPGPSSYGPNPSGSGSDPQPGSQSYFPSSGSYPSGGSWYPSSSGSIPPFGPPPSDMFEGGRDQGLPREARRF